jgi:oligosaccharide repeat unit polymerase
MKNVPPKIFSPITPVLLKFFLFAPSTLFILAWATALTLHSMKLSEILIELNEESITFLALLLLVSLLATMLLFTIPRNRTISPAIFTKHSWQTMLALPWLALIAIHIQTFGLETPLLGSIRYTDYAVPPFTGLLNSFTLINTAIVLLNIVCLSNSTKPAPKKHIYHQIALLFLFLVVPLLQLNRQNLIGSAIIAGVLFFNLTAVKLRTLSIGVILAAIVMIAFGVLGDYRSGNIEELAQISQWPAFLPKTLIWPYVYVSTPINNLINYLPTAPFFPSDFFCFISDLFPSIIRSFFFDHCQANATPTPLVHNSFNVTTLFGTLIPATGIIGSIVIIFFVLAIANVLYVLSFTHTTRFWLLCGYSIISAGLILSIFANLVLHVVYSYATLLFISLALTTAISRRCVKP